ncbi:hypothetical protein V3O24_14355 [Methylobacter sp. Wu8]|jgi:hypothetical protein|uniref:SxtJ n=1 Tax=Methylobacter tundripaludum TaxID=173365 RepID=A0A2S6H8M9_9GAMM|nr:hypothetical protein [Methylobacter tundripaludum]MCF7965102.1 hypothetical protein [Methylobacter tundripaludum]MCK9636818.1 hypothetical protein [Methylobacter tundripaludum]PPK73780.1 hypothetical protein B0F88_101312 [Methylobacter tundripaludum]
MKKVTIKSSPPGLTKQRSDCLRGKQEKKPSERGFGITFSAAFSAIGFVRLYQVRDFHDYWWMAWLSTAAVFLLLAYFWVAPLRPLNNLWYRIGLLLSHVVNPLIMGIVFLSTIFPIGLLMRLFKKDLLKLRLDREAQTYWQKRTPSAAKQQDMKNQF